MRIYYFGELITETQTNTEAALQSKQPYRRPQTRPIREILDEEPDMGGRQLLAFQNAKKFIIRDFAHA